MGRELYRFPSNSNPGKYYNIIEANDGVIYCDCPSWKMSPAPKDCKHLRAYHTIKKTRIQPDGNILPRKKPDRTLQNAIDEEVRHLT